jgi:hypothetical protein
MLSGRELINEIEQRLSDLDADKWELSRALEQYILDNEDYFLDEWQDIQHNFSDKSKKYQLNLMLDAIQSETHSECSELQARIDLLDGIDDELEKLIDFEEDFLDES